jgi:uncharacterized protein (TIGR04255 family)
MNLPTQITPCPIIESNIEIRFSSQLPGDAIIGIIYSIIQPLYANCNLEQLPILQIPPEIRRQDPNLKDKPTHVIKTTEFNAHIGSSVLVIGIPGDYPGWVRMKNVVKNFIAQILENNIISTINYIALRYLNFFETNIFEHINLTIDFDGAINTNKGTIFRTEFHNDDLINALQITNSVHVTNNVIDADGSIIDITTVIKNPTMQLPNCIHLIDMAHSSEKELFFSLLKTEFLESLNPIY